MIYSSRNSRLGDCIWHAQILRKIGGEHTFYVPPAYLPEVSECLEGTEIAVKDIVFSPSDALSSWIACGRFHYKGLDWQNQTDLVEYLMKWGNNIARECGIDDAVFRHRQEMLCDFPAIQRHVEAPDFDILIINAQPGSAQCNGFDNREMNQLIAKLAEKHKVLCTNPTDATTPEFRGTLCQIGNLSLRAKLIVAVSTGAAACIHNIFGEVRTMLFLDPIRLDFRRKNISHHKNCGEMEAALTKEGWL